MTLSEWLSATGTTQKQLADVIGVTQGLISHWITGRLAVTPEFVLAVAHATGWRVTPHELRSDLYPNRHDALPIGHTDVEACDATRREARI